MRGGPVVRKKDRGSKKGNYVSGEKKVKAR